MFAIWRKAIFSYICIYNGQYHAHNDQVLLWKMVHRDHSNPYIYDLRLWIGALLTLLCDRKIYRKSQICALDDHKSARVTDLRVKPRMWLQLLLTMTDSGPLFTKRTDVLPSDLVKSRSREIGCYDDRVALKFGRHLDSSAADVPVKFQNVWKSLNPNLAPLRLHEILWQDVCPLNKVYMSDRSRCIWKNKWVRYNQIFKSYCYVW